MMFPKTSIRTFCYLFLILLNGSIALGQALKDPAIKECSGLAVSSSTDALMWVHNDSGDDSRFFLISRNGDTKAIYQLQQEAIDFEDIALYRPKGKAPILFIGDIGDNDGERPYISVYQTPEPSLKVSSKTEIKIKNVKELRFQYPDGARDAECLMVDARDQKIYIISKREDQVSLYSAPINSPANKIVTLKKEIQLSFPGAKKAKRITAGDISTDGSKIIVKSYQNVFYWKRKPNETVVQCLKRPYTITPYAQERQGESIGFTKNGLGYYTISEGKYSNISLWRL